MLLVCDVLIQFIDLKCNIFQPFRRNHTLSMYKFTLKLIPSNNNNSFNEIYLINRILHILDVRAGS